MNIAALKEELQRSIAAQSKLLRAIEDEEIAEQQPAEVQRALPSDDPAASANASQGAPRKPPASTPGKE